MARKRTPQVRKPALKTTGGKSRSTGRKTTTSARSSSGTRNTVVGSRSYERRTLPELQKRAKQLGIANYSSKNKSQLIVLLRKR